MYLRGFIVVRLGGCGHCRRLADDLNLAASNNSPFDGVAH
jgi:hypothetical protein